ncbi:MAG: hypothetical protein KBD66_01450, partial [Candidatus Doudnabacteria bacterium]|nr:hypothetical protein [Candidatus Doudnabacteria bacterium]
TSSVSELVFRVLVAIDEVVAIPPAATALLTGIFHATDRLRTERTTPDTFAVVADLVAAGANYRTVAEAVLVAPRFSSMQLYGRILARLHESHEGRALYAFVQEHDLEKTGEQEVDTLAIATRIIREMPRTEVIVLGVPTGGGARVEVVSVHELQVKQLEGGFSVGGWNIRLVQGLWHATMVRSGNEQSSAIESLLKVGADRLAG